MNAENNSPSNAVNIASQTSSVGALNVIDEGIDKDCNSGAEKFNIQDKGSGSKISSFS